MRIGTLHECGPGKLLHAQKLAQHGAALAAAAAVTTRGSSPPLLPAHAPFKVLQELLLSARAAAHAALQDL